MSDKKPPSSQDLTDEIAQLKADVASLKARFATPANLGLEHALTALATEPTHRLSQKEKSALFEEIQAFKNEISALKNQIAKAEEKLAKPDATDAD